MLNQELLRGPLDTANVEYWERERTPTPVRAFAVRLHATGCSIRETQEILGYLHPVVSPFLIRTIERDRAGGATGWFKLGPTTTSANGYAGVSDCLRRGLEDTRRATYRGESSDGSRRVCSRRGTGTRPERVADRYNLDIADIYEALAYYHNNPEEIQQVEQRHERTGEEAKRRSSLTPPEN